MTYTSPVVSLLTKTRPFLSISRPTGRKQELGQEPTLVFSMTGMAAVLLVGAATGWPLLVTCHDRSYVYILCTLERALGTPIR